MQPLPDYRWRACHLPSPTATPHSTTSVPIQRAWPVARLHTCRTATKSSLNRTQNWSFWMRIRNFTKLQNSLTLANLLHRCALLCTRTHVVRWWTRGSRSAYRFLNLLQQVIKNHLSVCTCSLHFCNIDGDFSLFGRHSHNGERPLRICK